MLGLVEHVEAVGQPPQLCHMVALMHSSCLLKRPILLFIDDLHVSWRLLVEA